MEVFPGVGHRLNHRVRVGGVLRSETILLKPTSSCLQDCTPHSPPSLPHPPHRVSPFEKFRPPGVHEIFGHPRFTIRMNRYDTEPTRGRQFRWHDKVGRV